MRTSGGISFNYKAFAVMASNLTGDEIKKAKLRTVRYSANILKKETDSKYLFLRKRKEKPQSQKKRTFRKGQAVVKVDTRTGIAKIHIMGDYMMKWFELGTKERKTKGRKIIGYYTLRAGGRKYLLRKGKGRRSGSINPHYYFRSAQNATEQRIFSEMKTRMTEEIHKIAKRIEQEYNK